jgi:hypothetical protein
MSEDIPITAWTRSGIEERLAALGIEDPAAVVAIVRPIVRELERLRARPSLESLT